jgi:hypothetical protein
VINGITLDIYLLFKLWFFKDYLFFNCCKFNFWITFESLWISSIRSLLSNLYFYFLFFLVLTQACFHHFFYFVFIFFVSDFSIFQLWIASTSINGVPPINLSNHINCISSVSIWLTYVFSFYLYFFPKGIFYFEVGSIGISFHFSIGNSFIKWLDISLNI